MIFHWWICVVVLIAGAAHHASAARHLSAAPVPAGTKQFLPYKDANGVWQPAKLTGIDFSTLTLADLPTPEQFFEISTTSPYPMPNIPLILLVNNTFKKLNGGKIPASVDEWAGLLLEDSTAKYVTSNLPHFLVKYLPNITMPDGKVLSVGEHAGKILLPIISDITGGQVAAGTTDAAAAAGAVDAMSSRMSLAAAPPSVVIKGINTTLEVVKKLPNLYKQVVQVLEQAVEDGEDPQAEPGSIFRGDGTLDAAGTLENLLNIGISRPTATAVQAMRLPPPEIPTKSIIGLMKAMPEAAASLGLNTTAVKLPDPAAFEELLQKADNKDLLVTDQYGRMDLLATLTQLPEKVPELQKVAQAVQSATKPQQGWQDLEEVAGAVVKMVLPKPRGPAI